MISRSEGGFLQSKWHWLVLCCGLLTLGGALLYAFGEWSVDPDEAAQEAGARYDAARRQSADGVKPADLEEYNRAARDVRSPVPLVSIAANEGSFLASEKRIHCKFCSGALLPGAKTCPFCAKEQPEERKPVVSDTDGDGLPDLWEKKYGLKPNDPSDATGDADGDLFTNAEEFAAKTDPTDRKDHPDYLDFLTLQLPLRQTFMPFRFMRAYKTPAGFKYQFKDPSRGKEYDRGIYSVLQGEEIGKSGFVMTKYEPLTAKKKLGGGMEKSVDVSVATVTRKADGKAVRLVIDAVRTPIDEQAKLVFARGSVSKEFIVVQGDKIDLNGDKYVIKSLKAVQKGAEVVLENELTSKIRTIQALEQ